MKLPSHSLPTTGSKTFFWIVIISIFPSFLCSDLTTTPVERLLLVVNDNSDISRSAGEYYQQVRKIPQKNICHLQCSTGETIRREQYEEEIKSPIMAYLNQHKLQDQILYIVLTKGIPLRISGTGGKTGKKASVDSELTLLYLDLLFDNHKIEGRMMNPYWNADPQFSGSRFFNRREFTIYLVTRLTGFSLDDIKRLIDRAIYPRKNGIFILDTNSNWNSPGNKWMEKAAFKLNKAGFAVILERSKKFLDHQRSVLGYASWGSNDQNFTGRDLGNDWIKGALVTTYVSTNARTFQQPPQNWQIGTNRPENSDDKYAGSNQSLAGDFIHQGVTGIIGYVYEPFLDGCSQPDILFPAYVAGYNLAESYYLSVRFLSWQTVIIGDPLCCPFASENDRREEWEKGNNDLFVSRRLKLLQKLLQREMPVSPGSNPQTDLPR